MREVTFPFDDPVRFTDHSWPNYVMGVAVGLTEAGSLDEGFDALFFGNVPIGSGLSSSAALEMSAALALSSLAESTVDRIDTAKIGQRAEHEYVGAKTGLLDQISSLFGREDHLVRTDFRSLEVDTVPFPGGWVLLVCDTKTKHSLGDSDYNERREACETAAAYFASHLDREVKALRDVTTKDLNRLRGGLDEVVARRAAHVIGENERVLEGSACLASGDIDRFGALMFASHESSRSNFENSCPELDFLVDEAAELEAVVGARLSGGGFGGSAVMLTKPESVDEVVSSVLPPYRARFGGEFEPRVIRVSAGASIVGTA